MIHSTSYLHDPSVGHRVPPPGRERFRFNLWINNGGAPANGQAAEIVIRDFRFSPSPGTFLGGCGVNPAGSARVLAGAPVLGGTVTLGIDNPAATQRVGSLALLLIAFTPAAGFPCGQLLNGTGMIAPVGELLLDPAAPGLTVPGRPWTGAGTPVAFPLAIPNVSAFVGLHVYAQGVLWDPGGAVPIGLADAFELCIRP